MKVDARFKHENEAQICAPPPRYVFQRIDIHVIDNTVYGTTIDNGSTATQISLHRPLFVIVLLVDYFPCVGVA